MRRSLFTFLVTLVILFGALFNGRSLLPVNADATICYVDVNSPGPTFNGTSWTTAYHDLQSALSNAACDDIHVAQGTYYPIGDLANPSAYAPTATFQLKNGVQIIGGYPTGGGETPDPSSYPTILDGSNGQTENDKYDWHVVTGDNTDATAVLDGFTITHGFAVGDTSMYGGGMTINKGSPTLRHLVFNANITNGGGGGLYLEDSSPTLNNVTFTNNGDSSSLSITAPAGGGMEIDGNSAPVLTNVTFSGNAATMGGGFYSGQSFTSSAAAPVFKQVTFTNNTAHSSGGGLYMEGGKAGLSDCTFDGNIATDGAGIYVNGGTLTLQDSTLKNGVAGDTTSQANNDGFGGGMAVLAPGSATIRNSKLMNNTAFYQGGGLYATGNVAMISSSVAQNAGDEGGGGIAIYWTSSADFVNDSIYQNYTPTGYNGGGILTQDANASFANLLLYQNSADAGAGMELDAGDNSTSISIVNATLADNFANTYTAGAINSTAIVKLANSIVYENSGSPTIVATSNPFTVDDALLQDGCPTNATCNGLVSGDPKFVNPQTPDYRVAANSPAVDAGDLSALPADTYDLDGDNNPTERLSEDLQGKPRVVLSGVDLGAYEIQAGNINWTEASSLTLSPEQSGVDSASVDRFIDRQGQSQWFKFTVQPDSKVIVTLTNLPANYDLTLYQDIAQEYQQLGTTQDLVTLSAEFAPDTFSPDTFSPDTFSPDTFSPDTFSPDTFSPDTFSPDTFSPDTFSPDTFSPDTFSPDTFSPDTFSPDTFSPDTFSPDTFSPDTFSPDTFSPDTFSPEMFSSAQTRSLIAVSAHDGTQSEGILINTWTRSGTFYIRVHGRNGAFNSDAAYHLQVIEMNGECSSVSPVLPASSLSLTAANSQTLILTNLSQTEGSPTELTSLSSNLAELASRTQGQIVDVGADARVSAAAAQAQANPGCVYAMNLEAGAIKSIVNSFWSLNPNLEYIVLVGNDHAIPFFRYPDNALLANETDYTPPVEDNSTSQASLKSGYVLSQDAYGSAQDLTYKSDTIPIPDLAVGRLVETASDINNLLTAYLNTGSGVVTPGNALVSGYDFLADDANAVAGELKTSLGSTSVDTLIDPNTISPEDPLAWTADNLRQALLGSHHDIVFLAGHFSASSTLAADDTTRLLSSEVLASDTGFTNTLVYSAGCHSGYNIVNADDVTGVTQEPDWAQVFAQKGATFIGGTGYQYGDTDFIEYSEQLYLDFTKQMRYGSGPVAVGQALVQAKLTYLADTPELRGIHEKTVLEATLFGLPMMSYNLPGRTSAPTTSSVVTSTNAATENPGAALGLRYSDLNVNTPSTSTHVTMNQTSGGTTSNVTATYLTGTDGVVANPDEPVLPLQEMNVTAPDEGYVLRGVGWRGGQYTDLANILPFTDAATEDLRAPHVPFYSDTFYPVRPWNVNYFAALGSSSGATKLDLMPAQYISSGAASLTGILRQFQNMSFRLFYSNNISTYTNEPNNWSNTPAQSGAPDISQITSTLNADGSVTFNALVTGDPSAGIQEVWIVYTFYNGAWLPLDLKQDATDTRVWRATLSAGAIPDVTKLNYVVEAVNGVGLVTMMTNQGQYYRVGADPAALPQGQLPVALALVSPASSGIYADQQDFTITAKQGDTPLAGIPLTLTLGSLSKLVVTNGNGQADASFFLAAQPGDYTLEVAFNGNATYLPAATSSPFTIHPGTGQVDLEAKNQMVSSGDTAQFTAMVTSGGLPLTGKPVALTLDTGGAAIYTSVATTNYAGQAVWILPTQANGSYNVKAWYGLKVSDSLDLSSPYYSGASDSTTLTVGGKTDLHVTANSKTLTYGDSLPTLDYTFTAGDFINGIGAEDVSGIICSAGSGPFTPAGSPYTITCSGGVSNHYNLIYATGTLKVTPKALTVTPNPATATAQYSDPNPTVIKPSYSGWVGRDGVSSLTAQPTCSTTRTINSPAGTYDISCTGGTSTNYTFTYTKGTFTVTQEDAYLEYSGDSFALAKTNLNLRVTVWDSAAVGYPSTAANPETPPNATLGDITKGWIQFNIYPQSTCGVSTSIAPIYAQVSDAPTLKDGIGTASATYTVPTEGSYCVIARLVASKTGGTNLYYTSADAQPAPISYYLNSGKFAFGDGQVKDPSGSMGNFSFMARYDSKGKPTGQLFYIYRGVYNGVQAYFIIRSTALTALQFNGSKYPITVALQGKATLQVIRARGGGLLYSDTAATFNSIGVDTNKISFISGDTFTLTVWDKNGAVYKSVPSSALSFGNIIIHLK